MNEIIVEMPSIFTLETTLDLSIKINSLEKADKIIFDFSATRGVEPFPMLLISSEMNRLRRAHPDTAMSCINFKHMTYAAHMGFFQAFGLDFGNVAGQADGNGQYLPLTIFSCENIRNNAALKGIEIGDEIEVESKQLAALLCQENDGAVFDTLSYSIRELIRNVVEHSQSVRFGICAQYWPSKKKAEVAILDRGIGIQKSLSNNPHIDATDDKKAINYALMPAVSGKAFKGTKIKQRGHWANSGFGLYMTSRICRKGGTFFIASGNTGMLLTKNTTGKSDGKRYFQCDFVGTAIRMVISTDNLLDLRDALESYRKEGFIIQNKYKEMVNIDPSSASLMLSEDFDLSVWDKILKKLKNI